MPSSRYNREILPVRGTGLTFDRKCKKSIPQLIELLRDPIYFTVFFEVFKRSRQKYPVIVINEDGLWSASNIEELGTICDLLS